MTVSGCVSKSDVLHEVVIRRSGLHAVKMAKAKAKTLVVRLVSMAGTGYFYMMTRNRLKDKLQLMKYDPVVRKHVLFVEEKVKKGK